MAIKGAAWKTTMEKNSPHCMYRMQVSGIKGTRERNRVEKAFADWSGAGDAWNSNTKEETLFFSKDFGDVKNFIAWGKAFQEFPLVEMDKNGDVKKYVKIGLLGNSGGSQRICSKCGVAGHNARTCGTERAVKSSKAGTRQCGKCGERGHNARTCKNQIVTKKSFVKKVKGKRQCGKCQGYGHNARTCKSLC